MTAVVTKSHRFYGMHLLPVEYESRDLEEILPADKIRPGLQQLGVKTILLYDRPLKCLPDKDLATGETKTPIKLLARLSSEKRDSPVFFFAYSQYNKKLAEHQEELQRQCSVVNELEEFRVGDILDVPLGGLFTIKSSSSDAFVRIRVTKINMTKKSVKYWAIDEAFYGFCKIADLRKLNECCANLDILAIPGIFETDPTPSQLERFDEPHKQFVMAKIMQPKYAFDFCPRKVLLA